MILLDANILLRMTDSSDPNYKTALDAVFKARTATKLVIAHQSLYEFCAVATRAKSANGLDMDRPRMSRWISRYRQLFDLLP
jgi:hypothetical protein